MNPQIVGLAHFWTEADGLAKTVAYVLLLMSLTSWYFIVLKTFRTRRARLTGRIWLPLFWKANSFEEATRQLSANDPEQIFSPLAQCCLTAQAISSDSLEGKVDRSELLTRILRNEINAIALRLENGLTVLASIGSTAPFVGLLGTVWGIYHALISLTGNQQIMIDKIAAPVGEALIMTAAGLAVAVPAVLAYNFLSRANRITLTQLDGFAHDLHAYLSTNGMVKKS
ncbi:MAG: MotA/TolQ/ExbB proton channel family protein [Burkholderiaceae bacterium]|nr:MotA/TolQ/ExbB proton channel family protein [Burkholderiaceae bacterium]